MSGIDRPVEGRALSGVVFANAIGAMRAEWAPLAIGALLFGAVPQALLQWVLQVATRGRTYWVNLGMTELYAFVLALCESLVNAWMLLVLVGAIVGVGRPSRMRAAIDVLSQSWAVVVNSALYFIGVVLGSLLLVVPGAMAATAWSVALCALVVERLGPAEALGRSTDLTRGRRWSIFGLLLVVGVFDALFNFTVLTVAGSGLPLARAAGTPLSRFILSPLLNAAELVVASSLFAAVYAELVARKEGALSGAIAATFD